MKSLQSENFVTNPIEKYPSSIVDDSKTQFPLNVQQSQYPLACQQSQNPLKDLKRQYPSYCLGLHSSDSEKSIVNSPKLSGQHFIYQFYVPTKNRPSDLGSELPELLAARPQSGLQGQYYQTMVFDKQKKGKCHILVPH